MMEGFIFQNTFSDLKAMFPIMAENGTKPEFEVYDTGYLYNLAYLIQAGFVKPPVYLQFVTGILGGYRFNPLRSYQSAHDRRSAYRSGELPVVSVRCWAC